MDPYPPTAPETALDAALADTDASVRLKAVMAAGIDPSPAHLEALLAQAVREPDFQVREMLTWALLRLPHDLVLPKLVGALSQAEPQARQQALHTLSKLGDAAAWPAVAARLDDADAEVVRTAWYAAVALVPPEQRGWLAEKLGARLGTGTAEQKLSLSRALVGLGAEAVGPVLAAARAHADEAVRRHAEATERLLRDPEAGFESDVEAARHEVALGRTRSAIG